MKIDDVHLIYERFLDGTKFNDNLLDLFGEVMTDYLNLRTGDVLKEKIRLGKDKLKVIEMLNACEDRYGQGKLDDNQFERMSS